MNAGAKGRGVDREHSVLLLKAFDLAQLLHLQRLLVGRHRERHIATTQSNGQVEISHAVVCRHIAREVGPVVMKLDLLGFIPPLMALGCFDFEAELVAAVVSSDYSNVA